MKSEHIEQLRRIHEQLGQIINEAEAELDSGSQELPGNPPEGVDTSSLLKELQNEK